MENNIVGMSLEDILFEQGVIGMNQLKEVWKLKMSSGKSTEEILIGTNLVNRIDVVKAKALMNNMDFVDLTNYEFSDNKVPKLIGEELARKYNIIPLYKEDHCLTVAMHEYHEYAIDSIYLYTSSMVKPVLAEYAKIEILINRVFGDKIDFKQQKSTLLVNTGNVDAKDSTKIEQDYKKEFIASLKIEPPKQEVEEKKTEPVISKKTDMDNINEVLRARAKMNEPPPKNILKETFKIEQKGDSEVKKEDAMAQNKEVPFHSVEKKTSNPLALKESNEKLIKLYDDIKKKDVLKPPTRRSGDTIINSASNEFSENRTDDKQSVSIKVRINPEMKQSKGQESKDLFWEKIGDILTKEGVITEAQLAQALQIQSKNDKFIGEILIDNNFTTREKLYLYLNKQTGIKSYDLSNIEISEDVIASFNKKIVNKYLIIPIKREEHYLTVVMNDPRNMFALDEMRMLTGMEIKTMLGDPNQIKALINRYYNNEPKKESEIQERKPFVEQTQNKETGINNPIVKESTKMVIERAKPKVAFNENKKDAFINMHDIANSVKDDLVTTINRTETPQIDMSDLDNAPVIKFVNTIFQNAVERGASDIHIEGYKDFVNVRFRIDGKLTKIMNFDKEIQNIVVARIKIISGLDIAEKRVPQDGRVSILVEEKEYDLRVSILPTINGEKIVIRIADKESFNLSKEQLGFFDDDLLKFNNILAQPHGIVIVTGPTGSGKSTTLYTALKELSQPDVNILTVEDPIEATIDGINQVQVNNKAGLGFAVSLRSFLRQDPDIIMVGEMRDSETAEIAIRAAITGHLVLSTLHTNDSTSTISRLVDMGIEPFLIASSVVGVLAQRLVRKLCDSCKVAYSPTAYEQNIYDLRETSNIFTASGCPHCNHVGYKGRVAVYELLEIDQSLREMIAQNTSDTELKRYAIANGMKTLLENGKRLVENGSTSIEEVMSKFTMK